MLSIALKEYFTTSFTHALGRFLNNILNSNLKYFLYTCLGKQFLRKTFANSFNALLEKMKFITSGWKRKDVKEESKANMQCSGVFGKKKLNNSQPCSAPDIRNGILFEMPLAVPCRNFDAL